jgi:hypothetical protein
MKKPSNKNPKLAKIQDLYQSIYGSYYPAKKKKPDKKKRR